MSLKDLAQHLRELEFPALRIEHVDGAHFRVLAFAVAALQRRQPVVVSFAPLNRPRDLHAVLCIGLSGGMQDRRFVPSALLITDSSEEPPGFGSVNARLEFSVVGKRERTGAYLTAWNRCRITLTGAISLQLVGSCVFRSNVTDRFGIVTGDFGNVTEDFGNVTARNDRQVQRCA